MILEPYQVMAKKTSPAAPLPQQTNKTSKIPQTHTGSSNKEMTDNALTATHQIMNASMAAASSNQTMMNKQKETNKTMFNPCKTIMTMKQTRNGAQSNTTTAIKEPLLKLRCRIKWWNQVTGKGAKTVYHQKITTIVDQLQKTDPTLTVYQFYTTDKNTLDQPYPPLQGKMKLPQDPAGLCQYCPGQSLPEQPGYTSICTYFGHTKPFPDIMATMNKWLMDGQVQISLTLIQEEKAQGICWLLYTTKQSNCEDLTKAIAATIGLPTAAHFKQIIPGQKPGMKASAVHLMVATQHTKEAMQHLEQIYGENQMNQSATQFPLGQRLLLAPLATELNDKNLKSLDQLLQKQAAFCKEIMPVTNNDIQALDQEFQLQIKGEPIKWTLRKVLMQLSHLEQE